MILQCKATRKHTAVKIFQISHYPQFTSGYIVAIILSFFSGVSSSGNYYARPLLDVPTTILHAILNTPSILSIQSFIHDVKFVRFLSFKVFFSGVSYSQDDDAESTF